MWMSALWAVERCVIWRSSNAPFPDWVWEDQHLICHLEALRSVVAIKRSAPHLKAQLVHLYRDSTAGMRPLHPDVCSEAMVNMC